MAAIDQYIERIADENLKEQIQMELARLMKKKSFGLVFEHHMPDNLLTPEVPIRRGTNVVIRNGKVSDVYEVQSLTETEATCVQLSTMNEVVLPLEDLVAIAQRGDVIYPYLKPMDSVKNALDSELWHTLIEADNYHALQLLNYLYFCIVGRSNLFDFNMVKEKTNKKTDIEEIAQRLKSQSYYVCSR